MDDPNTPDPTLEAPTPVTDTVGDGAEPGPAPEDDASTAPQEDPA